MRTERGGRVCYPLTRPAACGALRNTETKAERRRENARRLFRRINEGAPVALSTRFLSFLSAFANVLSGKLSWPTLLFCPFLRRFIKDEVRRARENNRPATDRDLFQRNRLF